jgi:hypothetical protein
MRFKHGYLWATVALFVITLTGHFVFNWFDYVQDAKEHGEPIEVGVFLVEAFKALLENWQAEFMSLIWQVGGLMFLYSVGSPQSKEQSERTEAKLDWIMKQLDADRAGRRISELEETYPKA